MFKRIALIVTALVIGIAMAYTVDSHSADKPVGPVNPIADHGTGVGQGVGIAAPVYSRAAALAEPDNMNFCTELSRTAYSMSESIRDQRWDRKAAFDHLQFNVEPQSEEEAAAQYVFRAALTEDVFTASDHVISTMVGTYLPGGIDLITPTEYPALVAQIILESCGYEYGKVVKSKLEEAIRNTPRTSDN